MSTFYGNFTDNSKPSFQFDRIYPNYTIMKLLEKSDGIFIGRQVLIEYDLNPIDFFLKYASDSNFNDFFTSKNISFSESNTIVEINGNTWTNDKTKEECYNLNETIDATAIYDSTVWEKIYTTEDGQKYIKIANLNAIIPTLQINNINPTTSMEIISTGVPGSDYYKLDVPKNWNFGVKEIDYYEAPLNDSSITGTISDNRNYIKVEPNENADTQELSIHLPAIGNAVAKMNKVIAEMGTSNDTSNSATNATWWAKFKYFDEITQNKQYLTETAADARYLSLAAATSTAFTDLYLTKADATANYLTKAEATSTTFTDLYLTKAEATSTTFTDLYLTQAAATANYFTKTEINNSFVKKEDINSLSSSVQQIEEDTSTTNNYASNNSWLDINKDDDNNVSIAHKKANVNYQNKNTGEIKYFGGATGNSAYGPNAFFTPQFNIDAAGHITNITNHSYLVTGDNIWIENNWSHPDSSTTGHILNTISHKIQPQLYDETQNINKIYTVDEETNFQRPIIYGDSEKEAHYVIRDNKVTQVDDVNSKVYIPKITIDKAGHITNIENNTSLMDLLFYKEGEKIEETSNYFPTFGWLTSSQSTIYLNVTLPKILPPNHIISLGDNYSQMTGDIYLLLRFSAGRSGSTITPYDYQYLYTGNEIRRVKSLQQTQIYQTTSERKTIRPEVTIENRGTSLRICISNPDSNTPFYPAYWSDGSRINNGVLINNTPIVGEITFIGASVQKILPTDANHITYK